MHLRRKIRKIIDVGAALLKEFLVVDDPIAMDKAVPKVGELPQLIGKCGLYDALLFRFYDTIHVSAAHDSPGFRKYMLADIRYGFHRFYKEIFHRERIFLVRKEGVPADREDF